MKYLGLFIALLYLSPTVAGGLFLAAGHPLIALVLWAGNALPGYFLAQSLLERNGPD